MDREGVSKNIRSEKFPQLHFLGGLTSFAECNTWQVLVADCIPDPFGRRDRNSLRIAQSPQNPNTKLKRAIRHNRNDLRDLWGAGNERNLWAMLTCGGLVA